MENLLGAGSLSRLDLMGREGSQLSTLVAYCADIGSVRRRNFGWARMPELNPDIVSSSTDIQELVNSISSDLEEGSKVALGFECPIFLPVPRDSNQIASKRLFEEDRPWSAGAGAAAMATGIVEIVWILDNIRKNLGSPVSPFLSWPSFRAASAGMFLWEAFVTKQPAEKKLVGNPHVEDATRALREFASFATGTPNVSYDVVEPAVVSLAGAALLRTGWSTDLSLLDQPCVVISDKGVIFVPAFQ